jgi:hypothetical protein
MSRGTNLALWVLALSYLASGVEQLSRHTKFDAVSRALFEAGMWLGVVLFFAGFLIGLSLILEPAWNRGLRLVCSMRNWLEKRR